MTKLLRMTFALAIVTGLSAGFGNAAARSVVAASRLSRAHLPAHASGMRASILPPRDSRAGVRHYSRAYLDRLKRHAGGNTLVVTSVNDSELYNGSCPATPGTQNPLTLRCAIAQANLDGSGDTIKFDIVPYDCSGYNYGSGQTQTQPGQICDIQEAFPEYTLTAGNTTIDGYSEPGASPNTNTSLSQGDNADIAIQFTSCNYFPVHYTPCAPTTGLIVSGSHDVVEGLAFNGLNVEFSVTSANSVLEGSFIGVTPDGKPSNASPNSTTGAVAVMGGSSDTVGVDASVSCGETGSPGPLCGANVIDSNLAGVTVQTDGTSKTVATGNVISGNLLGVSPNGSGVMSNNYSILAYGTGTSIAGNLVENTSNTSYQPLQLCSAASDAVYYGSPGIFIEGTGAITGNTVTKSQAGGILVGCPNDTGTHAVLSKNIVNDNGNLALDLAPQGQVDCSSQGAGPNDYVACPVITSATSSSIGGTACDNCTVEVFIAANGPDEAQHGGSTAYLGTAAADGSGKWVLKGPFAAGVTFDPTNQQVTATATTPASPGPAETSEFATDFPSPEAPSSSPFVGPGHTFTVTTTTDNAPFSSCPNGPGGSGYSLRCAITDVISQQDNWGDTINFDIPSTDSGCDATTHVCTINVSNQLPSLTSLSTVVDGYSQPGSSPNSNAFGQPDNASIKIRVDGGGNYLDGLTITQPHDLVDGLSITGFGPSNGACTECNRGVVIYGYGAQYDAIQGDFIGEAPDGSSAGNGLHGIEITGTSNDGTPFDTLIGGSAPGARNVIGGNGTGPIQTYGVGDGVYDNDTANSGYASIEGNYVGTDPSGTAARPNGIGLGGAMTSDLIGGGSVADGNLISGNIASGVELDGAYLTLIGGNRIGTDAAGTGGLPNGSDGILLSHYYCGYTYCTSSADIGASAGQSTLAPNTVADNREAGIMVGVARDGGSAYIGQNSIHDNGGSTSASLTVTSASESGNTVLLYFSPTLSTPPAGSVVVSGMQPSGYNGTFAITASSTGYLTYTDSVSGLGNSTTNGTATIDYQGLGIDNYPAGPSCTAASPPQGYSPVLCPVISSATASAITGTASTWNGSASAPCAACTINVYQATQEPDDDFSGTYYGEGKTFLGTTTTDSNGNWTCSTSCAPGTKPFSGLPITATAMDTNGTSEFSADVTASTTSPARRKHVHHTATWMRKYRLLRRKHVEVLSQGWPRPATKHGERARAWAGATPATTKSLLPPRHVNMDVPGLKPGMVPGHGRAIRSAGSGPYPRSSGGGLGSQQRASQAGKRAAGLLHRRSVPFPWEARTFHGKRAKVHRFHAGRQPTYPTLGLNPLPHAAGGRAYGEMHYVPAALRKELSRLNRISLRPIRHGSGPITLTVTTWQDVACSDPAGMSLRCAIMTANNDTSGNPITIGFSIASGCATSGLCQLSPMGPLPTITRADVTINGYGQRLAQPNTNASFSQGDNAKVLIGVDGRAGGPNSNGLIVAANGFTLKGVFVNSFVPASPSSTDASIGNQVVLQSGASGATLSGDVLGGAAPRGALVLPNTGLQIDGGGAGTIGGTTPADTNIASGSHAGIELCAVSSETVEGNYVGTDPSGEKALTSTVQTVAFTGNGTGIQFDNSTHCAASGTSTGDQIGTAAAPNLVSGNGGTGIDLGKSTSDMVQGNIVGLDATGSTALGNLGPGILVEGTANTIGGTGSGQGNVIGGNGAGGNTDGIHVTAGPNTFEGNYIGTDITGANAVGNVGSGIGIPYSLTPTPTGEVIAGNVISASSFDGIFTGCSTGDTIHGNKVGTNAAGTAAIGSQPYGIFMGCEGAASNATIGGASAADRNIISGNSAAGLDIYETNVTIQGNYIGTDVTGKTAIGNGTGIRFDNCGNTCYYYDLNDVSNELIGGTAAGDGNVISGNNYDGISFKFCIQSCVIQGNKIGTSSDGSAAVPNQFGTGIRVRSYCPCNFTPPTVNLTIGGTAVGAGNLIAHNEAGIVNDPDSSYTGYGAYPDLGASHVAAQMNQIYDNSGWFSRLSPNEIYLGSQGPACESSSANSTVVNDAIACPTITGEKTASNAVTEVDGQAPTNSSVEVWTASNGSGDAGRGGSMVYLGTVTATGATCGSSSCPSGTSSWILSATAGTFANGFSLVPDQAVTATATLPVSGASPAQNETSEFAKDFATFSTDDTKVVVNTDLTTPGVPCDNSNFGQASFGQFIGTSGMNLRCAISEANLEDPPTVTFNLPSNATTITPAAPLPPLLASGLTVNGYSQSGSSPNTNAFGKPDNAVIKVQIDGSALGGSYYSGLNVDGQNQVIEGLSITNFPGAGVEVDNGSGLQVTGDFLGITPGGMAAGNTDGVDTYGNYNSSNPGATIGGTAAADRNVIGGNFEDGIYLDDENDTVQGTYVGTNPAGTAAEGNGRYGLSMDAASGAVIGGTATGAGNVFSGNAIFGVYIWDYASNNAVVGNLIGTDATGDPAIPNGTDLSNCPSGRPCDGSGVMVDNVTYGGGVTNTTIGPNNVISGNVGNGVELDGGSGSDANNVVGNLIGLSAVRTPLGNGGDGVYAHDGANGDAIGGTATGQGNTIADNHLSGVQIGSSATDGTTHVSIQGNTIRDNMQSPGSGFKAGSAGEIYLTGENPSTCTTANVTGAPNDALPCPQAPATPTLEYNSTTGLASVMTCAGCTVDFYTFKRTSSTAGGGSGAADQGHGGSLKWVGQATPTGGTTACDPTTSGSCSDSTLETTTLPTGLAGITTTATISYSSGAITDTSEFGSNTGSPTVVAALSDEHMAARSGADQRRVSHFPPKLKSVYFDYSVLTASSATRAAVKVFAAGSAKALVSQNLFVREAGDYAAPLKAPANHTWQRGRYCTVLYEDGKRLGGNGMPLAWNVGGGHLPTCAAKKSSNRFSGSTDGMWRPAVE